MKPMRLRSVIIRSLVAILLVALGVMLAEGFGGVHSVLVKVTTRNPLTIAATGWLHDNAPRSLFYFEQDLLANYTLAPYFFLSGILAGFFLSFRHAALGSCLPLGYAVWTSVALIRMTQNSEIMKWYHKIDMVLPFLSLVPIYIVGCNLGVWLLRRESPRLSILDCLIAMSLVAILAASIAYWRLIGLDDATVLVAFTWLAWRTRPTNVILAES
jgi:hypothetical protein